MNLTCLGTTPPRHHRGQGMYALASAVPVLCSKNRSRCIGTCRCRRHHCSKKYCCPLGHRDGVPIANGQDRSGASRCVLTTKQTQQHDASAMINKHLRFHMLYQIVEVFGIDKYLQCKEIYVNGKAVDGRLIDVLNKIRLSGFVLKTHIQVDNGAEKYTFEKQ